MLNAEMQKYIEESADPQHLPRCRFTLTKTLIVHGEPTVAKFAVSEDPRTQEEAIDLVNTRYSARGYGELHTIPLDAQHATFVAEVGGRVVGTITLAVDSRAGLAVDRTFPGALAEYRGKAGKRVCELTKFAFEEGIRSPEAMAGLFHLVYIYGAVTSGCTDLLIEVNPRHAPFYEKMLGFRALGEVKLNRSVGAPSQLMAMSVRAIGERIHSRSAAAEGGRSLYKHFFSRREEEAIQASLASELRKARLGRIQALQGALALKVEAARGVATDIRAPLSQPAFHVAGAAARPSVAGVAA